MRTADQIEELTKHKTKPYQQLNYLDKTTTENLIKLFKYAPKIVNSGRLQHIDIKKIGITNNICDRLKRDFGNFKKTFTILIAYHNFLFKYHTKKI